MSHKGGGYASDLGDEQWAVIEPLIPVYEWGRPRELDMRVGVAGMGDNSKCPSNGCIDLEDGHLKNAAAFWPGPLWLVSACQAGGSGISNKALTRHRRRARPAAIAGDLER